MRHVPVGFFFATVDDEDYERVAGRRWHVARGSAGVLYAVSHIKRDGKKTMMRMHRLLTDERWSIVDHRNHDGLDNRQSNLRDGSGGRNLWNMSVRKGGTSRFKGVCRYKKTGQWQATIAARGQRYHLGFFDDEVGAALAYDLRARELHGEFAVLNFPTCEVG